AGGGLAVLGSGPGGLVLAAVGGAVALVPAVLQQIRSAAQPRGPPAVLRALGAGIARHATALVVVGTLLVAVQVARNSAPNEAFEIPGWWDGSLRELLGWTAAAAGGLVVRRAVARVVPGGLLGALGVVGKRVRPVVEAVGGLPGRVSAAREARHDRQEAIDRLRTIVEQEGTVGEAPRGALVWAMGLAVRAGVDTAEIAGVVGLPEPVVALVLGHRDTVSRMPRVPNAGEYGPETELQARSRDLQDELRTRIAEVWADARAGVEVPRARWDRVHELLVDAETLGAPWAGGMAQVRAAAEQDLGWELRWVRGGVEVRVPGGWLAERAGSEVVFTVPGAAIVTAAGKAAPTPDLPAELSRLYAAVWWGLLAAPKDVPPVVSALNTLAQLRGPPAPDARLDPKDPLVDTVAGLLAHEPAAVLDHPALTEVAVQLVEHVRPALAAARQRLALLADPVEPARAIVQAADTLHRQGDGSGRAALERDVRAADTVLEQAREALVAAAAWREKQATDADGEGQKHREKLVKARTKRDRGAAEGVRKEQADLDLELENARRARASHDALQQATAALDELRRAHDELLQALQDAAGPGAVDPAATERIRSAAAEVLTGATTYREVLARTTPEPEALPSGTPTGPLPRLAEVTDQVNAELARLGLPRRFTEAELDAVIRAEFRRAAAPQLAGGGGEPIVGVKQNGLVLQVPARRAADSRWAALTRRGRTAAEVRITWHALGLVAVPDPLSAWGRTAAELMLGSLPQGGAVAGASTVQTRTTHGGAEVDVTDVVESTAPSWLSGLRDVVKIKGGFGWSSTRTTVRSASAGSYSLGGGVADNRGASTLYEVDTQWRLAVRTGGRAPGAPGAWKEFGRIGGSAAPGGTGGYADERRQADLTRLWVSHAYDERGPPDAEANPAGRQPGTPFPAYAPIWVGGLEQLVDKVAVALGTRDAGIGGFTRGQLRAFLVAELGGRLDVAAEDGLRLLLPDRLGRPAAHLEVTATPVLEKVRLVGGATRKELLEDLHVWFSTISAGATTTSGRSSTRAVAVELAKQAREAAQNFGPGGGANRSRSTSRADGMSSSQAAIRPGVHRLAGHSQAYVLRWQYTVRIQHLRGRDGVAYREDTVTGSGDAMVRIGERDAYRYGLPVAKAALTQAGDGTTVVRGTPVQEAPPGRLAAPPTNLGNGRGQMRSVGHGLVRDVPWAEVLRVRHAVEERLRRLEVLPPRDVARWTHDPAVLAAQLANQREVRDLFSPERWETGYDQAVNAGLAITVENPLSLLWGGRSAERMEVVVQLVPEWGRTNERTRYLGHSPSLLEVGLYIQSNTSSRSAGGSWGTSYSLDVGSGYVPGADQVPADPGVQGENQVSAGVNGRGGHGRSGGQSAGTTVNVVTLVEGMGSTAGFEVGHRVVVTLRRRGAADEVVEHGVGSFPLSIWLAADLLPDARGYRGIAEGPLPDWMRTRLVPMAVQADQLFAAALAQVEGQLDRGWYLDPEGVQDLREFTGVDRLAASLLELSTSGLRRSVLVRSVTGRTRWIDVELRGGPARTRLLTIGDLLTGDINLTLNSQGGEHGWSAGGGGGASAGGGVGQLEAPAAGGKLGGSGSVDRGANRSALGIWGREFLGIELGKHHVGQLDMVVQVRVGRAVGSEQPPGAQVDVRVWHAIPERDVLDRYAAGEHDLPLDVVADAVERMVAGDLLLDLRTTRLLVSRYVGQLRGRLASGRAHELPDGIDKRSIDRHLVRLTAYLNEQIRKEIAGRPAGNVPATAVRPGKRPTLKAVLRRAAELVPIEEPVEVPPNFETGMGESVIERADLTDAAGRPTELFDQVLAAVRQVAPDALDGDTLLWNVLANQFAGKRWRGHLDRMLGPDGMPVPIRVSTRTWDGAKVVRRTRWVTLTIRAEFDPNTVWAGKTDTVGLILQDYAYLQLDGGRRYGRGAGAELGGDGAAVPVDGGPGLGPNASVGTGRNRGRSAGVSGQATTLRGVASWNGANRVRHGIRITITPRLEAAPPQTRARRLRSPAAEPSAAVTGPPVELTGQTVRLLPDGLVQARSVTGRAVKGPMLYQPAPGLPFTLPTQVRVDGRGAPMLSRLVTEAISRPELLGRAGTLGHYFDLLDVLQPIPLSNFLDRIATADGYRLGRYAVPGVPGEAVDVIVRADLLADRVVVGSRPNTELRGVFRDQLAAFVAGSVGHLRPTTRGAGTSVAGTGLGVGLSVGDQTGHSRSQGLGSRAETSLYEQGPATTIQVRVVYHVTLRRVLLRDDRVKRVRYELPLPNLAVGTAYVTAFDADLAGLFRPSFGTGGGELRFAPLPRANGTKWPEPLWGPGPAAHPGGTASSGGFSGGALAVGGYRATDNVLVAGVLAELWADRLAGAPVGAVPGRGPPEAGLRRHERLLVVGNDELVRALRAAGADPVRAADLADRMYAFSWRDGATGLGVVAVPAERFAGLRASGRWGEVLEHERRFHLDGRAGVHDHDADAARILGRMRVAPAAAGASAGGAALRSGEAIDPRGSAVVAHVVARVAAGEDGFGITRLPAGDPAVVELTGLPGWALAEAGCRGVCVVDGLVDRVVAAGGPADLVAWGAVDGWIYLDRQVEVGLRSGALGAADRAQLFRHELVHVRYPRMREPESMRTAPLPDMTGLAAFLPPRSAGPVAFTAVPVVDGRTAWTAPELGADAHPLLRRVVGIWTRSGFHGSGVLYRVDGDTAYVLTNRHVVEPAGVPIGLDVRVEVHTSAGTQIIDGQVVASPSAEALASRAAAVGVDTAEFSVDLPLSPAAVDVAVVRIVDARLTGLRFPPLDFADVGPGQPVAVLGYPSTSIPRMGGGAVAPLRTHGMELVVTGGQVFFDAVLDLLSLGVTMAGNPWTAPGGSGGPLVAVGEHARPDVVLGLHSGAALPKPGDRWGHLAPVALAVPGPLVRAFVEASGVGGPDAPAPPLSEHEYRRIAAVPVTALITGGRAAGLVANLAPGVRVPVADVLAAVERAPELLLTRPDPAGDPGMRMVVRVPGLATAALVAPPAGERAALVRLADGQRLPVHGSSAVIGSGFANDVQVPRGARTVSEAVLLRHRDGWSLVALPGAGPVLVDGRAVDGIAPVGPASAITVAGTTFRLRTGGGAALLSGRHIDDREAAVVAHVVARLDAVGRPQRLAVDDPAVAELTGGLDPAELVGCAGVCVVDGLARRVAAAGGPADLVAWAGVDGWIHVDARVAAALRSGLLDPAARRALFRHELAHLAHPGLAEAQVAALAAVPDLAPLAAALAGIEPVAGRLIGLRHAGRPVRQAAELGAAAHPLLDRVVRVTLRQGGHVVGVGSGVLYRVDDGIAYVLTNRHVVEPTDAQGRPVALPSSVGVRVAVPLDGGTVDLPARVVAAPSPAALAAELAGLAGVDAELARWLQTEGTDVVDVAVLRVVHPRLAGSVIAPLRFADPVVGDPVTVLGFPDTTVPVLGRTGPTSLATAQESLVAATGRVFDSPRADAEAYGTKVVGVPWAGVGHSGGPMIGARSEPDVVHGLTYGYLDPAAMAGWTRGQVVVAVPAAVVRAYLHAAGVEGGPDAPGLAPRELARLGQQITARLTATGQPNAPVSELAAGLRVLAQDVLAAAAATPGLQVPTGPVGAGEGPVVALRGSPGPLSDRPFGTGEVAVLGAALAALRDRWLAEGLPLTADRIRGPPALHAGEELFSPSTADLVAQLEAAGMAPGTAAALVSGLVAFSWRDGTGTAVIAVPARVAARLDAAEAWGPVLDHERRFHLDPAAGRDGHDEHARQTLLVLGALSAPEQAGGMHPDLPAPAATTAGPVSSQPAANDSIPLGAVVLGLVVSGAGFVLPDQLGLTGRSAGLVTFLLVLTGVGIDLVALLGLPTTSSPAAPPAPPPAAPSAATPRPAAPVAPPAEAP
uniref:serine protease n=1 Tax=Pseudonocardia lacus TaxID=2835865 RepID=UPI001BDD685B